MQGNPTELFVADALVQQTMAITVTVHVRRPRAWAFRSWLARQLFALAGRTLGVGRTTVSLITPE